jgi:hypothetical protein
MLRLNGMIIETVTGRDMHLKHCAAVVHQESNGSALFCYFKGFDPRTLYGAEIIQGSDFSMKLPQNLYLKRAKETAICRDSGCLTQPIS